MSLNDVYRKYLHELQNIYSPGEAAGITSIVFEYAGGITRSDVIKDPNRMPDEKLLTVLEKNLEELLQHKPVQYITGEALFCNMKLKVSGAVLIPRPETEELVWEACKILKPDDNMLDIGTGSGSIAIAVKKARQDVKVTALDKSSEALEIAKENAKAQGTPLNLKELDFLEEVSWKELGSYEVIISNPPYIPLSEKAGMDKHVTQFEPHLALFVPENDPLIFYKKIAAFGKEHLIRSGKILVETHEDKAGDVAAHFLQEGYEVVIRKDIFGKERMVIGGLKGLGV